MSRRGTPDHGRRLLVQGLLASLWPLHASGASALDDLPDEIRQVLIDWDGMGWHWTGSDVEEQSAKWLAALASSGGITAEVSTYPFTRTDVLACTVRCGDARCAGLPMFDAGSTSADGVTGTLCKSGEAGDIAVLEVAPSAARDEALYRLRSLGRYRAAIVITAGGAPGLAPLDLPDGARARNSSLPVIEVSSEARAWLVPASAQHRKATVVASFEQSSAWARNVVAAMPGLDKQRAPIIVLAGRSGWGPCVGERAGGLAVWMRMIGLLSTAPALHPILMVATSGCELGDQGAQAFVAKNGELVKNAAGWMLLGANLGVRQRLVRIAGSSEDLLELARRHLRTEHTHFDTDALELPAAASAPTLSYSAAPGPLYHLPSDQLPAALDVSQVSSVANACARTLFDMAGG